jgi:hypothetical protein
MGSQRDRLAGSVGDLASVFDDEIEHLAPTLKETHDARFLMTVATPAPTAEQRAKTSTPATARTNE